VNDVGSSRLLLIATQCLLSALGLEEFSISRKLCRHSRCLFLFQLERRQQKVEGGLEHFVVAFLLIINSLALLSMAGSSSSESFVQ